MTDPKSGTLPGIVCIKCEQTHHNCAAHARTGDPCGRKPSPYMRVCTFHGGASPQALRAAAERKASAVVVQTYDADPDAVLAAQGVEPVADPVLELGKLAAASVHFMDALGARVNALDALRFTDAKGTEQLASEVALWERAMDRTARILKLLVDTGFEQRRLALDEATAGVFVVVMRRVVERLGLPAEKLVLVDSVVAEELRAIDEKGA